MKVREMARIYHLHRNSGGEAFDVFVESLGLDPAYPVRVTFDRIETDWLTIEGEPAPVSAAKMPEVAHV